MFKHCACPVSLTCIHTQQQAMWCRLLEVEALPIDCWHDRNTRTYIYAIKVKHETLPANRAWLFDRTRRRTACTALEDAGTNLHPRAIELRCRRQANLKHFVDRYCSIALHCTSTVPARGMQSAQQWPLFSSVIYASGHDRSQCTTTKDRSRKREVMAAL